jgi:hypothetical protein
MGGSREQGHAGLLPHTVVSLSFLPFCHCGTASVAGYRLKPSIDTQDIRAKYNLPFLPQSVMKLP